MLKITQLSGICHTVRSATNPPEFKHSVFFSGETVRDKYHINAEASRISPIIMQDFIFFKKTRKLNKMFVQVLYELFLRQFEA